MHEQSNASLAKVKVGGRQYSTRTSARCSVCRHPDRLAIEKQVVDGRPFSAIAEDYGGEHDISARNVRTHFECDHLPVDNEAVTDFVDKKAEERGMLVERTAESVVDYVAFLRNVIDTVDDLMEAGDILPSIRDALSAARLLAEVDTEGEDAETVRQMKELFAVHLDATRRVMSADQLREWSSVVGDHPLVRQLLSQPSRITKGRT